MATNIIVAAFALCFGLVTFVMRFARPDAFAKLGPMKERYGDRIGLAIHWTAYTVLPIVVGAVLLVRLLLSHAE